MNSLLQFLIVALVLVIVPSNLLVGAAPTPTTDAAALEAPAQSLMLSALAPLPVVHDQAATVENHHQRQRRQSYNSPNSDYYSNYYNDYYNNYYNSQNKAPAYSTGNNYNQYRPASADRFDGNTNNFNAIDSNNFASNGQPQPQVINGQKYTYTPLFQYKATQGHHQKLFVPNLFG